MLFGNCLAKRNFSCTFAVIIEYLLTEQNSYIIMEEILITEQELDYFTNIPDRVCEEPTPYQSKMSFEEAVKACNGITLEQFSAMWEESIRRLIPNP